jgi:hypothetical protein
MQIGVDSFAAAFDETSLAVSASDRVRNLVEQIEHADQVGLLEDYDSLLRRSWTCC